MTTSEDNWLPRVSEECRKAILCLGRGNEDDLVTSLGNLRKLFEEEVEVTDTTWSIHNNMASIAMAEPAMFKGRELLRNSAVERLTQIRRYIKNVLPVTPTANPFVSRAAAN